MKRKNLPATFNVRHRRKNDAWPRPWGETTKWVMTPLLCACAGLLIGCAGMSRSHTEITQQPFGKTKDGADVSLFTLRNAKGVEARISNYGGLVVSLTVPD